MTEERKAFIPRPKLAQSNFHHEAMGSTHRHAPDTPRNWHKPAHEFLSDAELRLQIDGEIRDTREMYQSFNSKSDAMEKARLKRGFLVIRDKFLFPNLYYLQAIGRLQGDISITKLEEEFGTSSSK